MSFRSSYIHILYTLSSYTLPFHFVLRSGETLTLIFLNHHCKLPQNESWETTLSPPEEVR